MIVESKVQYIVMQLAMRRKYHCEPQCMYTTLSCRIFQKRSRPYSAVTFTINIDLLDMVSSFFLACTFLELNTCSVLQAVY